MASIFLGHTMVAMQAELHGNHLLPSTVSQDAEQHQPGRQHGGQGDRFGP